MKKRLPYLALLTAAFIAWWISDHTIIPWIKSIAGYNQIQNKDLSIMLGHWIFGQLPRVLISIAVWLLGLHFGLMPSLRQSLGSGVSWHKVIVTGSIATLVLLILTIVIGFSAGGTFGFHPYFPKMAGDLISNMYEEIEYRGLMFCAFYGLVAGSSFQLVGKLNRAGIIAGTIGSCIVFAAGHGQYSIALRVVLGVIAVVFAYPWVAARSLWAPWIAHMLVDVIGDSILKL